MCRSIRSAAVQLDADAVRSRTAFATIWELAAMLQVHRPAPGLRACFGQISSRERLLSNCHAHGVSCAMPSPSVPFE
jgi:hypothetical protein